jgi:N-acyl-D-amino-acid deacylase
MRKSIDNWFGQLVAAITDMTLLIRGADVLDGTGAPYQHADILIQDDTIIAVGVIDTGVDETIDADGLTVCPGFIDIHSHTDHLLFAYPLADSKLLQGVTLELGGNCGFSAAPPDVEVQRVIAEELVSVAVTPDWSGMADFLDRLETSGIGPNFATLVGHGNLRGEVVGFDNRPAQPGELQQMQAHASRALQEGAFGISAGLIYPPGCYSDSDELATVCAVASGRGFFSVHMRDEGAGLLSALTEVIEVARRARVPLQVSHHKVGGKANWGLVGQSIAMIDAARAAGMDITADVYPYIATNTSLAAVLPDWMRAGGTDAMLARLNDPAALARIADEWGDRARDVERWDEYALSRIYADQQKDLQGQRIGAICRRLSQAPLPVIARILLADAGRTEMMRFCLCEADVAQVLRQPWVMVGSDASAKTLDPAWGCPHPRAFGTFPRVLAEYVRKRGVISLPEAIRKMTFLPAWRLGLKDRGRIAPGCKADLVIFDAERITDTASYEAPLQSPVGIAWVIVNGVVAAHEGRLTGARPGKIIRSQQNA